MSERSSAAEPVRRGRRVWAALLLLAGLTAGAVYVIDGRGPLEKIATRLVLPVGLVWVVTSVSLILACGRGRGRHLLVLALLWLMLTLSGNGLVVEMLAEDLERDYLQTDPLAEPPCDAVIVLGGGVSQSVGDRMEVNGAGDRVVLAARLFHAGRTEEIYCTGRTIEAWRDGRVDQSRLAKDLLISLGVPAEAIHEIGGANTAEEIAAVARQLGADQAESPRIGLITSAWHMPRAMRLAEQSGVELIPLPADYLTPRERTTPPTLSECVMAVIPSADALEANSRMLKEYLARAVGR